MTQKYALYINGKALLFNNPQDVQQQRDGHSILHGNSQDTLLTAIEILRKSDDSDVNLLLPDLDSETGFSLLKNILQVQKAAGGILEAPGRKYLFIKRLGMWDLPKGKPEGRESELETAIREVIEETGVPEVSDPQFICYTYHTYPAKGELILKETAWYHFRCQEAYPLNPQTEEAIEKAEWFSRAEVYRLLPEAWPSVRDLWFNFEN